MVATTERNLGTQMVNDNSATSRGTTDCDSKSDI